MWNRGEKRKSTEPVPAGVEGGHGLSPVSSLSVRGIGDFATGGPRHHQETFQVKEKHEQLSNGVRFNVETVSPAKEEHLQKSVIGRAEFLSEMKDAAMDVYNNDGDDMRGFLARRGGNKAPSNIRLEAVSTCPDNLVYVGSQGFFAACLAAFAQHLPLAISPDHIWAVISFAFAQHVDKHAEELRANFVQHEGKKRLEVSADHMVMSGNGNPDSGTPPEVWEATIFSAFSNQIKQHIGEKVHGAIASDFSTTTATSRAVHEVTLMSAMKHYFSYGMSTCCGIPNITLLGTEEDWVTLRARAEALGKLMTPKFSKMWIPVLLPVLDEFVSSYKGKVNHGFWQSMVKLRYRGGSGARSVVSGWIQILFPYLKGGSLNSDLRPWHQMYFRGPNPNNIPPILSSAPVDWNYYGSVYNLHFCAGFTGCTQDPTDGRLTPALGWFVAHDPPKEPKERLEVITKEIQDLLKGHSEEATQNVIDVKRPWYVRVSILFFEREAIIDSFKKKLNEEEKSLAEQQGYTWYSDSRKEELKKRTAEFEEEKTKVASIPLFASPENMIKSLVSGVN